MIQNYRLVSGVSPVVSPTVTHCASNLNSPRDCDAIIVNYNAGELLTHCVLALLSEGAGRVIVVDNGSQDVSLSWLDRDCPAEPRLLVIQTHANLGFAKACNIGAKTSSARNLLFLNPDCILESGTLDRLIAVLEGDPSIGMVGGFLCNPDGSEQPGGRRAIPTPWRSFVRAFSLSRFADRWPRLFYDFHLHKQPLPSHPTEVEAISGACMLVRRVAMQDVGHWDEGYFLHCEDLDLCMTLRRKGWKIMFVPDARIVHDKGGCSRARPIFVEWHKHRGMLRFYRKFFRHQYPGPLMWLVALGVWLRFAVLAVYHSAERVLRPLGRGA